MTDRDPEIAAKVNALADDIGVFVFPKDGFGIKNQKIKREAAKIAARHILYVVAQYPEALAALADHVRSAPCEGSAK